MAGPEIATPEYWVQQVRQPVRFADGVATLHAQGVEVLLEIGPQPVLLGMAGQAEGAANGRPLMLASLRPHTPDWERMLASLGDLYVRGMKIDWVALDSDVPRRKVMLPAYPFQRQRYWPAPKVARVRRVGEVVGPLVDRRVRLPGSGETLFETALSVASFPFLADHRVYGKVVAPGAYHVALALSAAETTYGGGSYAVHDVIFPQALVLEDEEAIRTVHLLCKAGARVEGERGLEFQLTSFADGEGEEEPVTTLHATGTVGLAAAPGGEPGLAAVQVRCSEAVDVPLYAGECGRCGDVLWPGVPVGR